MKNKTKKPKQKKEVTKKSIDKETKEQENIDQITILKKIEAIDLYIIDLKSQKNLLGRKKEDLTKKTELEKEITSKINEKKVLLIKKKDLTLEEAEKKKKEKILREERKRKEREEKRLQKEAEAEKLKVLKEKEREEKRLQKEEEEAEKRQKREKIQNEREEEFNFCPKLSLFFKDFMRGNFSQLNNYYNYSDYVQNNKFIVDKTYNYYIVFDYKSRVFTLYAYLNNKFGDVYEVAFAQFRKIEKFIYNNYTINYRPLLNKKKTIEIYNSKDEEPLIYELNSHLNSQLLKFIKIGTEREQELQKAMSDFISFLRNSDLLEEKEKLITNCYGVFDDNLILLPSNCELSTTEKIKAEYEINEFERIFKEKNIILNNKSSEEVKNDIIQYYDYLKNSIRARLTAQYSICSIFQYYLKYRKGLKEFPHFLNISKQTGTGKSKIININSNLLIQNKFSDGYEAQLFKNSPRNLTNKSNIPGSIAFDDLRTIDNPRQISLLVMVATSIVGTNNHMSDNKSQTDYLFNTIIGSANKFGGREERLAKRFITIDFNNKNIYSIDNKSLNIDVNHIFEIMPTICVKLWENILLLFEEVKKLKVNNKDRGRKAHIEVLRIGEILLNKFFNIFNLPSFPNIDDYNLYMSNSEELITTEEDDIKKEIYSELIRVTSINLNSVDENTTGRINQSYNYTSLFYIEDTTIRELIIKELNKKGIGVTITDETLKLSIFNDVFNNFNFKNNDVKKLSDFTKYLTTNEDEILKETKHNQSLSINNIKRKGIILTFKIDKEPNEEKIESNSEIEEIDLSGGFEE